MQIIDAHVHALPRGEMCGGEVDARLDTVLKGLREHGIERAVLVPINDLSWQPVDEMNDFSVETVGAHPNIVGLIDIDLSQAHYAGGIERLEADIVRRYESGLRGIKIHPQNLGVQASDWRLWPVYRLAGELNIPVMIHCHPGSCPGRVTDSHPAEIEKVVRAFHKTTFIIAHFGGILYFEYMPWLVHSNVWFESSGIITRLRRYHGDERIRYVFEEIGYDRICFGSDFPTDDLNAQLAAMRELVPPDRHADVFAGNITRLGCRLGWWKKL